MSETQEKKQGDGDDKKKVEVESFSVIPKEGEAGDADAVKVRIRRISSTGPQQGKPEPVICVPVPYKGEYTYWRPDAEKQVFDVDALTAHAAVGTGGFEVDPASRVKLKV